MIYRRPGFFDFVLFGSSPNPSPPLLPSKSFLSFFFFLCRRSILLKEDGEKGGRGAKSHDREKAWLSINHSVLSGEGIGRRGAGGGGG